MNTEPSANRCPKCQAPLPTNSPLGLCAKCLLAAVSTPTEAGQPSDRKPPPPIATVAAAFPQLEILELIGHGGMGVVYKARQPRLDRLVALKLLPQSLAADAAFAERFNREARVLARLNHPNIVTVHDFGQSGGFFYLLMEFVDGVNLRQAMQAGRFTPQQAMMLVPRICEALQFAHDEGILHRDIKPENILLDTKGRVKIADFGIAKLIGEARENLTLTASGQAVGTPHYMAPEQLEHPQDVDQRADIYSLGVVFYEMLTGELPIGRFAPPSQKSSVDARVDEVVFHALEKEREKRFRTAGEVKTSVEAITSNPAPRRAQAAPPLPSHGSAFPERRLPCYISTPEHLNSIFGQLVNIYTGKGELMLDAESLTFVSNWESTIIPLRDIRELNIGHYSRLAKPIRLDYLAVTFEQAGQHRTLFFTPMIRGGISLSSEVNPRVADCWQAVREAVVARTGKAPGGPFPPSSSGSYPLSPTRQAIKLGLVAAAVAVAIVLAKVLLRSRGPQDAGAMMSRWTVFMLASLGLGGLIASIVRAIRGYRRGWKSSPTAPTSSLPGPSGMAPMPANPAAGAGNPSAGAAAHAISEARATCYFNTPRRMRDCFPSAAARIFTCKGVLQLDSENLTFTSTWRTTIAIALKDIKDLSIGQFQMWTTPWVMKYARINFLHISYRQQGQLQTVHLTPVEPGSVAGSQINECVGRWFDRVREAVHQCTGTVPHASDTPSVSVSAEPAWNRKGLPLLYACLLVGIGSSVLPQHVVGGPLWFAVPMLCVLLAAAVIWFSVGFLQANSALGRGNLDAVTSDDPPAAEPASASRAGYGLGRSTRPGWLNVSYVGYAGVVLLVALLVGMWGYGNRSSPSAGGRVLGSPSAPETEGQFVLYTLPPRTPAEAGPLNWNFKYLVPAHHVARILFVCWTDGVPQLESGLSAYFKVGQTSMDGDILVSCERLGEAVAGGTTNDVQWKVSLFSHISHALQIPERPPYRPVEPPARLTVRSGRQGVLRLVDGFVPDNQTIHVQSGVEFRIFLEPMSYPPGRTDPFEIEGTNYVAGSGAGWTEPEVLKAIKQWPADP
jgi:serine/threonine protein kinase